jgi:hypothetical protein
MEVDQARKEEAIPDEPELRGASKGVKKSLEIHCTPERL